MLDACPHHHPQPDPELEGLTPRSPRTSTGKRFWRSLQELANTPEFEAMMHREFPQAASEWKDGESRRHFLKLMGASLALGGLSACTLRKTPEKIVPYVNPPEEVIPGRPLFFASTMPWCGYGKGVIVESHEGRPTKIEGNPDHPASLGATDVWGQASVLDLYDPDRSQVVLHGQTPSSWGDFVNEIQPQLEAQRQSKGAGLRILSGAVTSPTIARQINQLLQQMPGARWHQYEPIGRENARDGAIAVFGRDVQTLWKFETASVIVSLDSNFLLEDPGSVYYARRFIDGRRIRQDGPATMNRLYAAESTLTLTGAMADHRLPIKSSEIAALARDLASTLDGATAGGPHAKWISAVASDLQENAGQSIVIAGQNQPPAVHALVHAINSRLGNIGKTVTYIDPVEAAGPNGPHTLAELVDDMNHRAVDLLLILGTNPSFTAPQEWGLWSGALGNEHYSAEQYVLRNPLSKVRTVIHHGMHGPAADETAFFATWHIPASHYLEAWGDMRAFDGTASIIQPLIEPLYATLSEVQLLAFFTGQMDRGALENIRDTWKAQLPAPFEASWQRAVEKGVIPNSAFKPITPAPRLDLPAAIAALPATQPSNSGGVELIFRPDPHLWDGRFANNGWLQELPKPLTLLTWDNAALMSLNTAARLKVAMFDAARGVDTQMVEIKFLDRTLRLPVLIMPGHAEDSITVYLGGGRGRSGMIGTGVGQNTYLLRTAENLWIAPAAEVNLTKDTYPLATSQSHHLMDQKSQMTEQIQERDLFKVFSLSDLTSSPATAPGKRTFSLPVVKEQSDPTEDMLPQWDYSKGNKWAMVIDNNACIGCNSCVIACQSENNIPIVGKTEVLRGREMHWIRIDTYFEGEADASPDAFFQPVTCMQCETAPCTLVCPVEATTISSEGINEQTYNRCVGTRYCSNNCPYKVRRFNFLYYSDYVHPTQMLQKNPNVTVRSRGIMEKCNYCIQRINNGRIEAKKQDRAIAPGEVIPACAQACPTEAIIFGNLNDSRWEITQLLAKEGNKKLHYTLLDDLNTRPRTSYLARVKNVNPELGTLG